MIQEYQEYKNKSQNNNLLCEYGIEQVHQHKTKNWHIKNLTISQDGNYLLIAFQNGGLQIFDLINGTKVAQLISKQSQFKYPSLAISLKNLYFAVWELNCEKYCEGQNNKNHILIWSFKQKDANYFGKIKAQIQRKIHLNFIKDTHLIENDSQTIYIWGIESLQVIRQISCQLNMFKIMKSNKYLITVHYPFYHKYDLELYNFETLLKKKINNNNKIQSFSYKRRKRNSFMGITIVKFNLMENVIIIGADRIEILKITNEQFKLMKIIKLQSYNQELQDGALYETTLITNYTKIIYYVDLVNAQSSSQLLPIENLSYHFNIKFSQTNNYIIYYDRDGAAFIMRAKKIQKQSQ